MRFLVSAILSAAVLATASGCGSDDEPSTTSPASAPQTTPTTTATTSAKDAASEAEAAHKAFLKKANPICRDYNREVRTVQSDLKALGRSGNVDVYVGPLTKAHAAAQRASERFDALKPPAAEASQATLVGRALQSQATGNAILLQAARDDDSEQFAAASAALAEVAPRNQALMRAYGMTVCGAAG